MTDHIAENVTPTSEDAHLGATQRTQLINVIAPINPIVDLLYRNDLPPRTQFLALLEVIKGVPLRDLIDVLDENDWSDDTTERLCGMVVRTDSDVHYQYDDPAFAFDESGTYNDLVLTPRGTFVPNEPFEVLRETFARRLSRPEFYEKLVRVRRFAKENFHREGSDGADSDRILVFESQEGEGGYSIGVVERFNGMPNGGISPADFSTNFRNLPQGISFETFLLVALSYPFPEFSYTLPYDTAVAMYRRFLDSEDTSSLPWMWYYFITSRLELLDCFSEAPYTFVKNWISGASGDYLIKEGIKQRMMATFMEKRYRNENRPRMVLSMHYALTTAFFLSFLPFVDAKKVDSASNFGWTLSLLLIAAVPWKWIGSIIAEYLTSFSDKTTTRSKLSKAFKDAKEGFYAHLDVEEGFKPECMAITFVNSLHPMTPEDSSKGSVVDRVFGSIVRKQHVGSTPLISMVQEFARLFGVIDTEAISDFGKLFTGFEDNKLMLCIVATIGWLAVILTGPSTKERTRFAVLAHHGFATTGYLLYLRDRGCLMPKHSFFKGESFSPDDDWFANIEQATRDWSLYKDSPFGNAVCNLVSVVMLTPVMTYLGVDADTAGLISRMNAEMKRANCTMEGILNAAITVVSTMCTFCTTGVLETGAYRGLDSKWVECNRFFDVVTLGTFEANKITPHEILIKYEELQEELRYAVKTASGPGKSFAEQRLISLQSQIMKLRTLAIVGQQKPAPFFMLLTGRPGTGKSCICESLHNIILKASGDKRIMSLAVQNESEAFDTTMTNGTTSVTLDDIGLDKPIHKKQSGAHLVRKIVSSIFEASVKADLAEKGKVFPRITSAIATSNVDDGGLFAEVVEPEALNRRVALCAELNVVDEVCSIGPDNISRPDSAKMRNASIGNSAFQNFHRWTVYKLTPRLNGAERHNVPQLTNVTSEVFLEYLTGFVSNYAKTQKDTYDRIMRARTERLCDHCRPISFCLECQDNVFDDDTTADYIDPDAVIPDPELDQRILERQLLVDSQLQERFDEEDNAIDEVRVLCARGHDVFEASQMIPIVEPIDVGEFAMHAEEHHDHQVNNYRGESEEQLLALTEHKRSIDFSLWLYRQSPFLWNFLYSVNITYVFICHAILCLLGLVLTYISHLVLSEFVGEKWAFSCTFALVFINLAVSIIVRLLVTSFRDAAKNSLVGFWTQAEDVRLQVDTWITRLQAAVALLVFWKVASTVGATVQEYLFTPESADIVADIPKPVVDPKVTWVAPSIAIQKKTEVSKTSRMEHLVTKLKKNLVYVTVNGPNVKLTKGLIVNSCYFLIPRHTLASCGDSVTMDLRINYDGQGREVFRTVVVNTRSDVYYFPDKDLVAVNLKRTIERPVVFDFFPTSELVHPFVFEWVDIDKSMQMSQKTKLGTPSSQNYSDSAGNKFTNKCGFSYPCHSYDGLCMSIGVHASGGVSIAGFHVAGNQRDLGFMVQVLQRDLIAAQVALQKSCHYVPPMEITVPRTELREFSLNEREELHPKCCVNFTTEPNNPPQVIMAIESTQTPRSSLTVHPLCEAIRRELPCILKNFKRAPLNFSRAAQPVIDRMCAVHDRFDTDLLNQAVSQVTDHLLVFARKVRNDFPEESDILSAPFTIEQVTGEIMDDNPFVTTVVSKTSAGSPIDKSKDKVFALTENNKIILDDVTRTEVWETLLRMSSGQHSGEVYTAIPKEEVIGANKDCARIFFAGSIITTVLTKMFFDPFVNAAARYPIETCCALGIDVTSDVWNKVIEYLTFGVPDGEVQVTDMDYKKYDATQFAQLRATIVPIVRAVYTEWGWKEHDLNLMEKCASLFLQPLLRVRDAIVIGDLQPSGTTMTGRGNSTINLVLQAYSFLKHNPDLNFFEYVHPMVQGDDNLPSMLKKNTHLWGPAMFAEDMAPHGVVVTPGEKTSLILEWKNFSDFPAFLGRRTYYNSDLKCYCMVLDPDARMKAIMFIDRKNLDDKLIYCQHLDFILRESFLAGRDEYLHVKAGLDKIREEFNLPEYGILGLSYSALLDLYKEKYYDPTENTFNFPDKLPGRYLIRNGCFQPESEDVLKSQDSTCKMVVGSYTPDPDHQARLLGGERIQSFLPLLKMFHDDGEIDLMEDSYNMSVIYSVTNPREPNVYNMVVKSFKGIRGSIAVNYWISADASILISRGVTPMASLPIPSKMGVEILDARVNPTTTIVYPGPIATRWIPITGYQPQVSMPCKAVEALRAPDGSKVVRRIAAGEDFSLLFFHAPPIVDFQGDTINVFYPESETVGLNVYAMDDIGEDQTSVAAVRDPTLIGVESLLNPMKWWERALTIDSIAFQKDQYVKKVIYPVSTFFNATYITPHLTNCAFFRGTVVVRMEITGGSTHSGLAMMAAMVPNITYDGDGISALPLQLRMMKLAHMPHAYVDIGSGGYVDLEIPFFYPQNLCSLGPLMFDNVQGGTTTTSFDPAVYINTLIPLNTTMDSPDTIHAIISVYWKELILVGATQTNYNTITGPRNLFQPEAEQVQEKYSTKASVAAGALANLAGVFTASGLPALALPTEIASSIAQVAAHALRNYGYSRPLDQSMTNATPVTATALSSYNANLHGRILAPDHDFQMSVDPLIAGEGRVDEMAFSYHWARWVPLAILTIPHAMSAGGLVGTINVTPVLCTQADTRVQLAGQGMICTQFSKWSGAMEYEFEFFNTAGTSGIITICHEPLPDYSNVQGTQVEVVKCIHVDLGKHKKCLVRVNWETHRPCLYTCSSQVYSPVNSSYSSFMHNGLIEITVRAPLLCGLSSQPSDVYMMVKARCVPETMYVFDLQPVGLNNSVIATSSVTDLLANPNGTFTRVNLPSDSENTWVSNPPLFLHQTPGGVLVPVPPPIGQTRTPSGAPSSGPVASSTPHGVPTLAPNRAPTLGPRAPTRAPTGAPVVPNAASTRLPTRKPTLRPSVPITPQPTGIQLSFAIPPAVCYGGVVAPKPGNYKIMASDAGTSIGVPYNCYMGAPGVLKLYSNLVIHSSSSGATETVVSVHGPNNTMINMFLLTVPIAVRTSGWRTQLIPVTIPADTILHQVEAPCPNPWEVLDGSSPLTKANQTPCTTGSYTNIKNDVLVCSELGPGSWLYALTRSAHAFTTYRGTIAFDGAISVNGAAAIAHTSVSTYGFNWAEANSNGLMPNFVGGTGGAIAYIIFPFHFQSTVAGNTSTAFTADVNVAYVP